MINGTGNRGSDLGGQAGLAVLLVTTVCFCPESRRPFTSATTTQLQLGGERWAVSPHPPAQTGEAINSRSLALCYKPNSKHLPPRRERQSTDTFQLVSLSLDGIFFVSPTDPTCKFSLEENQAVKAGACPRRTSRPVPAGPRTRWRYRAGAGRAS